MVCSSCKTAGELNERGLKLMERGEVRGAETAFDQSEFFHDDCVGCDCQHSTRVRTS